ncbi:MAG: uracil phosphoribosyltransferase [Bacteroidia bacterium]
MVQRVINLGESNSLVNEFVSELRDETGQQDRMRFRRNLIRLGEIFAYEISKHLEWENREVTTPLGVSTIPRLKDQPVLAAILRAALPMHQGMLNFFDKADNAFISAYRQPSSEDGFEIRIEYVSAPALADRVIVVVDPMLATGSSLVLACEELLKNAKPKHLHLVSVISSVVGIDFVKHRLSNFTIWTAAIDEELTAKAYIVPGLGDAGDLAYGEKDV